MILRLIHQRAPRNSAGSTMGRGPEHPLGAHCAGELEKYKTGTLYLGSLGPD